LNGDEISEFRIWDQTIVSGRVGERAMNVESVYDYGSRVGVWRLLNLFEKHKMPVTAYAVGQAFEMNREVAKAFTQNGHEVASHAYRY
jgi:peptidoglycan/xylan/chitin deacetylase (PgdA/CDA1 family)